MPKERSLCIFRLEISCNYFLRVMIGAAIIDHVFMSIEFEARGTDLLRRIQQVSDLAFLRRRRKFLPIVAVLLRAATLACDSLTKMAHT
jgi:hypothetical protein